MKYTPQEFINIWNESKDTADVMEKTGFAKSTVWSMASRLRAVGFDLKVMPAIPKKEKHVGDKV